MILNILREEFSYKRLLGLSLKRRGERIFQRAEWNTKSMNWKTENNYQVKKTFSLTFEIHHLKNESDHQGNLLPKIKI